MKCSADKMVLGNMIMNKSYDKRYDVPFPFPANASVAYTRGENKNCHKSEVTCTWNEVSEGEVKIWVFFLLNTTNVLYVEYIKILFTRPFCMCVYFFFQ